MARRETPGVVRRADGPPIRVAGPWIRVVGPRRVGTAGEPDGAAVGIGTGEAAAARRPAPERLGLGEAWLTKGVGLEAFDGIVVGVGRGGALKRRPKLSNKIAAPLPMMTSSRGRFSRTARTLVLRPASLPSGAGVSFWRPAASKRSCSAC